VIGAAALAVHGVSRATGDLDLLTVDLPCLEDDLWDPLRRSGAHPWQREVLGRASPITLEGTSLAIVAAADLVLLELYAGGPQDAWVPALPGDCAALWERIQGQRR
jgi:hypothetical protein